MLKYFKKKEEVKEFKPNMLSKILNVLPFIPLAMLLLAMLSAKMNKGDGIADQDITAAELVAHVQPIVGIDYGGIMYTSIEAVDNTIVFNMAATTVEVSEGLKFAVKMDPGGLDALVIQSMRRTGASQGIRDNMINFRLKVYDISGNLLLNNFISYNKF